MTGQLSIAEILGLAASVSLLSGWRLYLCVLATGLAMHFDLLPLPEHLAALKVLASPWVMGAAGGGAGGGGRGGKLARPGGAWGRLPTRVRALGGALLALAVIDPADPATQAIAFILGGGASLLAHGGKASARAAVNTSPEPFSNMAVSTAEDILTGGLLVLAYAYPVVAGGVALMLLALTIWLLLLARKVLKRLFAGGRPVP